jgi:raffinose/stachyose/melibiose transport system substrate-binding protein
MDNLKDKGVQIMRNRVTIALIGAATAACLALAGCSNGGTESGESGSAGGGGGSLEVYFNMTSGSPLNDAMDKIVKDFEQQTGATVDVVVDQAGYEDAIKVRLASGDIPDVFATHGWSVMRYSEFLEPLNDREWAQYVNKGLDASMRDAEGNIYAVPLQYTVAGIGVNFDVLKEAGVDPDGIKTWDDFNAAGEKIKAAGKTVIANSGKDGLAGNLINFMASGAFSDDELQGFLDGTFQSDTYSKLLDMIAQWSADGWFNADYVSASTDDVARSIAEGQSAFIFEQPDTLNTALTYNADANLGFIPYPNTQGEPYLVGGEGIQAYGVSKTSENKDLALQFVDFLAEPDNAAAVAAAAGSYTGLTDVTTDLGVLGDSYTKWMEDNSTPTLPFFDRAYLPSGMFDTMKATTDGVISGQTDTASALAQMESQFTSLYGQSN